MPEHKKKLEFYDAERRQWLDETGLKRIRRYQMPIVLVTRKMAGYCYAYCQNCQSYYLAN